MSLFRPTSDPSRRDGRDESASHATLKEAIMDSVSSVRDSLPEQHHEHFETLRQEIIDFAKAHDIPRESLSKPDALTQAARKLSTSDLTQLANLLERFEYLLKNKEPREEISEAIEYAEEFYHLKKQYDLQVELLTEVGILENGTILGIDGKRYSIPTLEQITVRLFERRETLKTKYDQGFTKLLLVPFGMSLDALQETFKQFLLSYKQNNPTFDFDTNEPLWIGEGYQGADTGDSPKLVYYPQSFTKESHGGKTKMEILKEQTGRRWTPTSVGVAGGSGVGMAGESGAGTPGWTIHLLQPSDPTDSHSLGFALIPRQGQGTPQGDLTPRPHLEAGKTPNEYLSILQSSQDNPDPPYSHESGMTPEDWIMAFILHLQETGKPLDDAWNPTNTENFCYLIGAFFSSSVHVPGAFWSRGRRQANLIRNDPRNRGGNIGVRTSVMV